MSEPFTITRSGDNSGRISANSIELFEKLKRRLTHDQVSYTIEPTKYDTAGGSATLPAFVFQGVLSLAEVSIACIHDFRLTKQWGDVPNGTKVKNTHLDRSFIVEPPNDNGFRRLKADDGNHESMEALDQIDHSEWQEE